MSSLGELAKPEIIWFGIGLILLLMEIALPGLVIFFFGIGAWVVSIVCFVTDVSLNAQLIIFLISSIFLLLVLRHRLKSLFYGFSSSKDDMSEDMQEYVGQAAIVVEEIKGKIKGRVEFHGTNWDAIADDVIPDGVDVEIVSKDNLTFKVKAI
ncbi:MAG: NfeD family protein [bacterium]|nr:NfeD family protein [bacterium]